jgi:uncharacterized protein YcfJ
MNRIRLALTLVAGLVVAAPLAARPPRHTDYVYATVERVEPIVRYVTVDRPRRECRDEVVYEPLPDNRPLRSAVPTLAGGIIGGVIGSEISNRRNRGALTLAGAVAGAAIATDVAVRNHRYRSGQFQAVTVERCDIVSERFTEERIDGYNVIYRYQGRRYTMRTSQHPGDRVRLRVSVVPVGF